MELGDEVRSGRRPIRLLAGAVIAAGLAALVLIQAAAARAATCETYDEFTYLQLGVRVWRHGDFQCLASPMCPPLPIVLEYWLPALHAEHTPGSEAWLRDVPRLTREARLLTAATIGVPLVWLVAGWLARRRGLLAGALGGVLLACSPTILASASIATTDACFALFAVLALGAIRRYQARPTAASYWLMGAGIGLALGGKQSAAILFPVAALEVWLRRPASDPALTPTDRVLRLGAWAGLRLGGLVASAFLVAWACYGFGLARFGAVGTTCTIPVAIPMVANLLPGGDAIMEFVWRRGGMPLAIDTFVGQMNHAKVGHSAYLMGATSMKGWWSFFPVALAIKSTPAELALMAIAGSLAFRRASWRDPTRRAWLLAGLAMLGSGMASSINIGQRYMILLYPLAVLLGVDALAGLAARARRPAWAAVAGLALAVGQGASAWGIAPFYLSYFNLLIGGPMEGHRYLLDSSLDWGQDLPSLRRELDARGYRRVALCYFGTGSPAAHGIRSASWSDSDEAVADCDWLAISASSLHGLYGGTSELYDRFKDLPSGRAAYSIFLYNLKDPRVRDAWRAVRARTLGGAPAPAPGPSGR